MLVNGLKWELTRSDQLRKGKYFSLCGTSTSVHYSGEYNLLFVLKRTYMFSLE